MAHLITLEATKTYATRENAIKAFEKKFGHTNLRYIIMQHTDGRFFPAALFDGGRAMHEGVHFHFHVIG
jgi:hypothetical protein